MCESSRADPGGARATHLSRTGIGGAWATPRPHGLRRWSSCCEVADKYTPRPEAAVGPVDDPGHRVLLPQCRDLGG